MLSSRPDTPGSNGWLSLITVFFLRSDKTRCLLNFGEAVSIRAACKGRIWPSMGSCGSVGRADGSWSQVSCFQYVKVSLGKILNTKCPLKVLPYCMKMCQWLTLSRWHLWWETLGLSRALGWMLQMLRNAGAGLKVQVHNRKWIIIEVIIRERVYGYSQGRLWY